MDAKLTEADWIQATAILRCQESVLPSGGLGGACSVHPEGDPVLNWHRRHASSRYAGCWRSSTCTGRLLIGCTTSAGSPAPSLSQCRPVTCAMWSSSGRRRCGVSGHDEDPLSVECTTCGMGMFDCTRRLFDQAIECCEACDHGEDER